MALNTNDTINEGKNTTNLLINISAREFAISVIMIYAAFSIIGDPDYSENFKAWAWIGASVVSAVFIGFRFVQRIFEIKNTTP